MVDRILEINLAVREEACAGLPPATRDMLMGALDHMKNNLATAEAAANEAPYNAKVAE